MDFENCTPTLRAATREKSIAQLLGWEWHHLSHGASRVAHKTADGRTRYGQPTPDDMLAWLKANDSFVALVLVPGNDVDVEVRVGDYQHCFFAHVRGGTLAEALEAAVRKVAGNG